MSGGAKPVVIVGAGGHARVLVSILEQVQGVRIVGVADRTDRTLGEKVGSAEVIATISGLPDLWRDGVRWAALAIGDNEERAALFAKVKTWGFSLVEARHPTAIVERDVCIGEGAVIGPGAILCTGVTLAPDVLINTGAIVDHECKIGAHAHIGPGSRVAGRVTVGEGALVGAGSTVLNKLTIGEWCVIGAGSVVVEDIPTKVKAYGVPAKVQRPL